MVQELVNFKRKIGNIYDSWNLTPSEGLHILIELKENGEIETEKFEFYDFKHSQSSPFWQSCIFYETNSSYIPCPPPAVMNKAIDSKGKIQSCTPFALTFKPEKLKDAAERIVSYFEVCRAKCFNDILNPLTPEITQSISYFENYCKSFFYNYSRFEGEISGFEKDKPKKWRYQIGEIKGELKICKYDLSKATPEAVELKGGYVNIYLKVPDATFKEAHKNYLRKNILNDTKRYNKEINEETFGLGSYFNGFNIKKPFLEHKTAAYFEGISRRLTEEDALLLYEFERLRTENKVLPNPLPVFIDENELNSGKMLGVFREGGFKMGYSEIIKKVFENQPQTEWGNYYLLNGSRDKIHDFDFVPRFRFYLKDPLSKKSNWVITNSLETSQKKDKERIFVEYNSIETIFDFEYRLGKLFFYKLTSDKKPFYSREKPTDGFLIGNYFNDLNSKMGVRDTAKTNFLKYRRALYDFIYKSQENALTGSMWQDLCLSTIIDEIKHDNQFGSTQLIEDQLNFWFSLNSIFDTDNLNFNKKNMNSQLPILLKKMREVANRKDEDALIYFKDDEEFLFAVGQLVFYLFNQSASGNRTHAVLDAFIQQRDVIQLKLNLGNLVNKYKHEISFSKGRFEKLAAQVFSFETKTSLQTLTPFLLAGYFAQNIIYDKATTITE